MTFYPDIGHRDERGDWPKRYDAAVVWLRESQLARYRLVTVSQRLSRHVLPLLEEARRKELEIAFWQGDVKADDIVPSPAIIDLIQDVERMTHDR